MKFTLPLVASLALLSQFDTQAAVIYSQAFTGAPASGLNATTVSTSSGTLGGTAGATWNANTNFNANGTLAATTRSMALLSFAPQSGFEYELSATVSLTGGFFGIGFCDVISFTGGATNNDRMITGSATNYGMMFMNAAVAPVAYSTYSSGANLLDTNVTLPAALPSYDLKITLDTTAANWAVKYYINGTAVNTFTHVGSTPIDSIGFTAGNATTATTFSNFKLQTIPEPSAALLGCLGLLGMLRRRSS
jgi:hypothetical protein